MCSRTMGKKQRITLDGKQVLRVYGTELRRGVYKPAKKKNGKKFRKESLGMLYRTGKKGGREKKVN